MEPTVELFISTPDYSKFSAFLKEKSGISLRPDQINLVENRLTPFILENDLDDFGDLLGFLKRHPNQLSEVIDKMTTNETLWFRDHSLWDAMEQHFIPQLFDALESGKCREIRIWSLASSTGQEPYSLAILIDEIAKRRGMEKFISSFHIKASDLSESSLKTAKAGAYSSFELGRGMSSQRKMKYFRQQGRNWCLNENMRKRVQFGTFNLLAPFPRDHTYDMILCRNVATYFSADIKRALYSKIARILKPKGLLFLGATESLRAFSTDYLIQRHKNATYHELK